MASHPKNLRLPLETYANPELRFHIVIHAFPHITAFPPPVADVLWELVLQQRTRSDVELLAACLMPDHLHWVLGPGRRNVATFLDAWKSFSTRRTWSAGHTGVLWQPRWYDRAIGGQAELNDVINYVVWNPVTANLCEAPGDWPYTWVRPPM